MTTTASNDASEQVRDRHVQLTATLAEIAGRRFDGSDRNRLVRVTVDGQGAFADLKIAAPRLHDSSPEELSAAVLGALAAARQTLATELQAKLGAGDTGALVAQAQAFDLTTAAHPEPARGTVGPAGGRHV